MCAVALCGIRITADTVELQVADNGAGLVDITKALILFSSTKSGHGLTKGMLKQTIRHYTLWSHIPQLYGEEGNEGLPFLSVLL